MTLRQLFITLFFGSVLIQVGLIQCAKAEPPYEITLEDPDTITGYSRTHRYRRGDMEQDV
jgi:hypothetical protein